MQAYYITHYNQVSLCSTPLLYLLIHPCGVYFTVFTPHWNRSIWSVYANEVMSQEFYGKKTLQCAGTGRRRGWETLTQLMKDLMICWWAEPKGKTGMQGMGVYVVEKEKENNLREHKKTQCCKTTKFLSLFSAIFFFHLSLTPQLVGSVQSAC